MAQMKNTPSSDWKQTRVARALGIEYPLQRSLVKNLALPAQKAGNTELLALWAGQSASLSHGTEAKSLLQNLVSGVSAKLTK